VNDTDNASIENLPLSNDTLTYEGVVMDGGGEVIEHKSFPHDRQFLAVRWSGAMRRRYGGRIIDHNSRFKGGWLRQQL